MKKFQVIGLITQLKTSGAVETLKILSDYLYTKKLQLVAENDTADLLPEHFVTHRYTRQEIGAHCDLVIVIGGDGTMLSTARAVVQHNTLLLGVNCGKLGFLTDIRPEEISATMDDILNGNYLEEERFLLDISITQPHEKQPVHCVALNEAVLTPAQPAHMIDFEIYINDTFMCSQRSDGLIIATPTGSTAYGLSAGGPILHPCLDAMVLIPIFPHTLSNRPIVIDGNSHIKVVMAEQTNTIPLVTCDSQTNLTLEPDHQLHICKFKQPLRLIHPTDYNYFEALRSKLYWGKKLQNK